MQKYVVRTAINTMLPKSAVPAPKVFINELRGQNELPKKNNDCRNSDVRIVDAAKVAERGASASNNGPTDVGWKKSP